MPFISTLRGQRFVFADLRELLAKANEDKSGDQLAQIAATSNRERVAARMALAELTLADIVENPLIDPDQDEVSRLILESLDAQAFAQCRGWTIGQLREWLLVDD